jgi:hypothetical protein
MKLPLLQFSGMLALTVLLAATHPVPAERTAMQNNWVKLADRTVTYTVSHSQIVLDGLNDNLGALKVKVTAGAINLHRCMIYYQNGQTQDVDVLNSIAQGGESKVIELPHSDQPIIKLVYVYDTKNRAIQKADVELWGRRN